MNAAIDRSEHYSAKRAPESLEQFAGWPPIQPGQLFVIDSLPYSSYLAMSDAVVDRPAIRFTYDRGRLEIMSTSAAHEMLKSWLGWLIAAMAEELERDSISLGSMTFRRDDLEKGFEPDDCFWFANEQALRGRRDYDIARDPPPDLLVEIEVTRRAIARPPLYAILGVPEVWRVDGNAIRILLLNPDRNYDEVAQSSIFPEIPVPELVPFLQPDPVRSQLERMREFRLWVRKFRSTEADRVD